MGLEGSLMPGSRPMKYSQFRSELDKGRLSAYQCFLFAGPEQFLKEQAVRALADSLAGRQGGSVNLRRVDCASTSIEEIKVTELGGSLFGGNKLVVLGSFQRRKPTEIKAFLKLMSEAEMHPGVTVAILHSPESNARPLKVSERKVCQVMFYRMFDDDVMRWIHSEYKEHGQAVRGDVASELFGLYGNDLARLHGEIEKTSLYASGAEPVTPELIRRLCAGASQTQIWDVVDGVASGQLREALVRFDELCRVGGVAPQAVLANLIYAFEAMAVLLALRSRHREQFEVLRSLAREVAQAPDRFGKKFQVARKLQTAVAEFENVDESMKTALGAMQGTQLARRVSQALRYEGTQLARVMAELEDVDARLKTSTGDPMLTVEHLILRICTRQV